MTSPPGAEGPQRAGELQAALDHLRGVRDSYWDYGWRRENRGGESPNGPPLARAKIDLPPR